MSPEAEERRPARQPDHLPEERDRHPCPSKLLVADQPKNPPLLEHAQTPLHCLDPYGDDLNTAALSLPIKQPIHTGIFVWQCNRAEGKAQAPHHHSAQ